MSRKCNFVLAALVLAVTVALPASASAAIGGRHVSQRFEGTLVYSFCDNDACPIGGVLTGHGPIGGKATVLILSDEPNEDFSETRTRWQLDLHSGTVILDLFIQTLPGDGVQDPCKIYFDEVGTWVISGGTGSYAGFHGEGELRSKGLAIGHDPSCGNPEPTSLVTYTFIGLVSDHRHLPSSVATLMDEQL